MLHINALTYRIGGRVLFDQATIHIPARQRVGLVGRNGVGKTTLFRLILNELHPDDGSLSVRPRARVATVRQELSDDRISPLEVVLAQDPERAALLAEAEEATCATRVSEVHERMAAIDAHSAPARAATILSGLGFTAEMQTQPMASFSGGWRMRVALAGALFARPDLLLLDEPTNHLDLEATLWLQDYLSRYDGTLLVISHDRELLNIVVDRIVHIENGKLNGYGGNYNRFEQVRRERIDLAAKAASKQLEQRRKLQSFIDRFRAKATKAAQAQSRVKMLEKLGPPLTVIEDSPMSFDFPDPDGLSPPLVAIEGGQVGYSDDKPVLRNLSLRIDMDDRIALLGANGNGKSTLAKLLAGRLGLQKGSLFRSGKLKIGYFAQHQADELVLTETPFDHMQRVMPDAIPSKVRAHLGRFGFAQERADSKVATLSGGEKARLLFALMSRDAPHLMILDEPTNHLDIEAREALVSALNAYDGAVIIISHDPHILELTADRLWLVREGTVKAYDGDLEAYRRLLLELARDARREDKAAKGGTPAPSRKDERRAAAEKRSQTAPLRKIIRDAEQDMEKLTRKKVSLTEKMADPALYSGPAAKLAALQKDLGEVEKALEAAEERWMLAQEELEAALAEDGQGE